MRETLERIEQWVMPESGLFWNDDPAKPVSYGAAFGSNGEREYIRKLAREALQQADSITFKVGDIVRIKGVAGPSMVVVPPNRGEGRLCVRCWYFNNHGTLEDLNIYAELLESAQPLNIAMAKVD